MSADSDKALDDAKSKMSLLAKLGLGFFLSWFKSLTQGEKMNYVVTVLAYVLKLDFWAGYRSYIAGVASMLSGLALLALVVAGDPHGSVEGGVAAIIFGLKVIGDAGKADNQIAATKEAAEAHKAAAHLQAVAVAQIASQAKK